MDIAWYRDLAISITGLIISAVIVFLAILVYSLYRRAESLLNSFEATLQQRKAVLESIEGVSSSVQKICYTVGDDIIKPVMEALTLFQSIRRSVKAVSSLFTKPEGKGGDNV